MAQQNVKPNGYRPRIVDKQIERYMRIFGAVEIAGTKWCGKTWAARAHANSITYVDRDNNLPMAQADPSLMLLGDRPHVIDEWAIAPAIWDEIRHKVDDEPGSKGQWLLTGSSTPQKDTRPQHTGAGRIGRIRMNPMSLCESGDSTGAVSLAGLFEGRFEPSKADNDTLKLFDITCRGGWPEAQNMPTEDAQILIREYIRLTLTEGVPKQGYDPEIARRLLNSLARNVSQSVTFETLRKDMYGTEEHLDDFISASKVSKYVAMFTDLFVMDDIPGWVPPHRSP